MLLGLRRDMQHYQASSAYGHRLNAEIVWRRIKMLLDRGLVAAKRPAIDWHRADAADDLTPGHSFAPHADHDDSAVLGISEAGDGLCDGDFSGGGLKVVVGALNVEPRTLFLSDQDARVARTEEIESRLTSQLSAFECP
ncbi:hypothetical protein B5181_06265 [Streptomyces sp. 4F]|nr:hypothetical protein B5181_06265 [Streptomyces sp. 4F]